MTNHYVGVPPLSDGVRAVTPAEWVAAGRATWNKYGAQRAESAFFPGVVFPSKVERDRAEYLLAMAQAGQISDLELHPRYVLSAKPRCVFTADARYTEDGVVVVEDTKGAVARDFRVRALWFKEKHPGVRVRVVTDGKRRGWIVKEIA